MPSNLISIPEVRPLFVRFQNIDITDIEKMINAYWDNEPEIIVKIMNFDSDIDNLTIYQYGCMAQSYLNVLKDPHLKVIRMALKEFDTVLLYIEPFRFAWNLWACGNITAIEFNRLTDINPYQNEILEGIHEAHTMNGVSE